MTISWQRCLRTRRGRRIGLAVTLLLLRLAGSPAAWAQKGDDALSQHEVDQLRDAAFVPSDRIKVFTGILNDRQKRLEQILAKRQSHTDFPAEMHDVLDQFASITDELNDNLDDYGRRHRDVRKALPKLMEATERWSTAIRTVGENESFNVVRRIALDDVKDTHVLAESLRTELDAYFKAHPEVEAQEKKRDADPHAVHAGEGPPGP